MAVEPPGLPRDFSADPAAPGVADPGRKPPDRGPATLTASDFSDACRRKISKAVGHRTRLGARPPSAAGHLRSEVAGFRGGDRLRAPTLAPRRPSIRPPPGVRPAARSAPPDGAAS